MTYRSRFGAPRLTIVLIGLALLLVAVAAAAANDAGRTADAGSGSSHERAAKVVEARQSFERGLKLFDEGQFAPAREAFQHAYDLAPSYRLLYNIGLAAKELGDHAGAVRMLESYLTEGTWEVSGERGAEVAALIGELMHRVGTNTVTTNVSGAQLFVDGVFAGQTPLEESLVLNPGPHTVEARAKGYVSMTRTVSATPGEGGAEIYFELAPSSAPTSPTILVVVSAVLLAGIGMFVLRRRRRTE